MNQNIEKEMKLLELCAKIAEVNCILSATGTTYCAIENRSPGILNLIALGVNLGFLSYDVYQIYKLDKNENVYEKRDVKQLIKTNNKKLKSNQG